MIVLNYFLINMLPFVHLCFCHRQKDNNKLSSNIVNLDCEVEETTGI